MIALTFEGRHTLARGILRQAIREQLERSLTHGMRPAPVIEAIADELLNCLDRPSLRETLLILGSAQSD